VGAAKVFVSGSATGNGFSSTPLTGAVELGVKFDLIFFPEIKRSIFKAPDDLK
jgi:hypothetical protein